jgi:hypothetical protein
MHIPRKFNGVYHKYDTVNGGKVVAPQPTRGRVTAQVCQGHMRQYSERLIIYPIIMTIPYRLIFTSDPSTAVFNCVRTS